MGKRNPFPVGDDRDRRPQPVSLARTFRRIIGIPPGEFLGVLRLQRAKELLLTTDLFTSEVCYEVGYASFGTFTSRFT